VSANILSTIDPHMPSSQWHSSQANIDRTNTIIKQIASMFKQSTVVTVIAPLNEYVVAHTHLGPFFIHRTPFRPAGFYGNDVLSVTRQVCHAL
jgi:glucan 1,3-beta-glucosidase